MSDLPNPPEAPSTRSEKLNPGSIAPPSPPSPPRRLIRWSWFALPGLYFAGFFVMVALDRIRVIPRSLYPPMRVVYFPLIYLLKEFPILKEAVNTFVNPFVKLFR